MSGFFLNRIDRDTIHLIILMMIGNVHATCFYSSTLQMNELVREQQSIVLQAASFCHVNIKTLVSIGRS